ncbi:unnamed protein product [Paramecium pentaurelia]|uniref:Uncharacterized protein n=1 Tax=Paramecium pentaurelia TaxID=43138 RepID=A0A8S1XZ87_9CILI|nr:unnamed protein product [Paramecium pentaurelia]
MWHPFFLTGKIPCSARFPFDLHQCSSANFQIQKALHHSGMIIIFQFHHWFEFPSNKMRNMNLQNQENMSLRPSYNQKVQLSIRRQKQIDLKGGSQKCTYTNQFQSQL